MPRIIEKILLGRLKVLGFIIIRKEEYEKLTTPTLYWDPDDPERPYQNEYEFHNATGDGGNFVFEMQVGRHMGSRFYAAIQGENDLEPKITEHLTYDEAQAVIDNADG